MKSIEKHMNHNSKTSSFSASTSLKFQKKSEIPKEFRYSVDPRLVKKIGYGSAYLYAVVCALSIKESYCFAQTNTLVKKSGMAKRTIERHLMLLERQGFIYRNTFPTKAKKKDGIVALGKTRHIIPIPQFKNYWKNFLNRSVVPDFVKKDFASKLLPENTQIIPFSPRRSSATHAPPIKGSKDLIINKSKEETRTRETQASPINEKEIEDELRKSKITGEKLKLAMLYYKNNATEIKNKKNPVSWMVKGTITGWMCDIANEKYRKKQEMRTQGSKNKHIRDHLARGWIKNIMKSKDDRMVNPIIPRSFKCSPLVVNTSKNLEKITTKKPPDEKPPDEKSFDSLDIKKIINDFKSCCDPTKIMILQENEGFWWSAENYKRKEFIKYGEKGILRHLCALAGNMQQEKASEMLKNYFNP
jgi:Helix-turn-helix domain